MNALNALQVAFQRYILQTLPDIHEHVATSEGIDSARRLRIYYDAYRLRLLEALASDYVALRAFLGRDVFDEACRSYVEQTPSTFRDLRWYGGGLPQFLGDTAPFSQQPVLNEIALFEWTLTLAFDAADQTAMTFDQLARIPGQSWPALRFFLHPCVNIIALRTNAPSLRAAVDASESLPAVIIAEAPVWWLIWRSDYDSSFRSLSELEAWALRAVRDHADFSTLCEGLCQWLKPDEAAAHAAGFLRQWVNDGLIVEAQLES